MGTVVMTEKKTQKFFKVQSINLLSLKSYTDTVADGIGSNMR